MHQSIPHRARNSIYRVLERGLPFAAIVKVPYFSAWGRRLGSVIVREIKDQSPARIQTRSGYEFKSAVDIDPRHKTHQSEVLEF